MNGFTVIQDWMLLADMGIAETLIYAVIYGFTQDGQGFFSGTREYLARKAKVSVRTLDRKLAALVDAGFIIKFISRDGKRVSYRANLQMAQALIEASKNDSVCSYDDGNWSVAPESAGYAERESLFVRDRQARQADATSCPQYGDKLTQGGRQIDAQKINNKIYINNNIKEKAAKAAQKKEASVPESMSETSSDAATSSDFCESISDFYNSERLRLNAVLPQAKVMTEERKKLLKARARESGIDAVREVITKACKSNFLNGGGDKGFTADLTWIMRPNNFAKVLEGRYDNQDAPALRNNQSNYGYNAPKKYETVQEYNRRQMERLEQWEAEAEAREREAEERRMREDCDEQ